MLKCTSSSYTPEKVVTTEALYEYTLSMNSLERINLIQVLRKARGLTPRSFRLLDESEDGVASALLSALGVNP